MLGSEAWHAGTVVRAVIFAALFVGAPPAQAKTYLLVRIQAIGDVPPPEWLFGYGVLPGPNRYPRGYILPNTRRHWRLESSLELVRVRPRRLLLRHVDFTDYWAGLTYPDRILAEDLVIKIRPDAIHFIGDLIISDDKVINLWRSQTLVEACEKYPEEMRRHRFILARPLAETDLEVHDPCNTDRLVMEEIR